MNKVEIDESPYITAVFTGKDLEAITTRLRKSLLQESNMSSYHIIDNPNGTFTVVSGVEERVIISTHNSREAAQRAIIRLVNRRRFRERDSIGR